MNPSNSTEVKTVTCEPAAIGLFGLAMVTLVASTQKLGWTDGYSFILPWAIFLGSFAQLFTAAIEVKRNNIFGATAFISYGLFWLGVAASWMMKMGVFGPAFSSQIDANQLAAAFIGYLIFSIYMTIGSLTTNKVLFIIFILIDLLFIGLAFSTMGIMQEPMHHLAAWSELLIALISFYGSAGVLLNNHFGFNFLPLGKPIWLRTQTK